MDMDIVKRFICGAKEAYKKVDDHSFNFPITIESAYRLATNIEKLLKEQEPIKPTWSQGKAYCGNCGQRLPRKCDGIERRYCSFCGKAVKWNDYSKND